MYKFGLNPLYTQNKGYFKSITCLKPELSAHFVKIMDSLSSKLLVDQHLQSLILNYKHHRTRSCMSVEKMFRI